MALTNPLSNWPAFFRFLNRHRLVLALAGGTLIVWLFYSMFYQPGASAGGIAPHFISVRRDTLFQTLTLSGTVHSSKAIELLAPMEWQYELQIVSLIPEGTQVQPGDTLLKFNTSKLQAELESARRELRTQQANLRELLLNQKMQNTQLQNQLTLAKLSLENAKLDVQKAKFESDVIQQQAQIALKQAEIQLRRAKQAIQNTHVVQQAERIKAEMAVKNAQTDVNSLKARIARFCLISPHAGMVVYGESWFGNGFRKIRLGDKVHAGDALIELPDLNAMESLVFINEVDVHKIKPGQKAKLWLEARPNHLYRGVVQGIAQISEPKNFAAGKWWENPSSVHVFRGKIAILNPDSSLKPGMTIKTRVFLDTIPNAWVIPAAALSEKNGKPAVYTPEGLKPIQIGARNNTHVVVLRGLTEKDRVQLPLPPSAVSFGKTLFHTHYFSASDSLPGSFKHIRFDTTTHRKKSVLHQKEIHGKISSFPKAHLTGTVPPHSDWSPTQKDKK